MLSALVTVVILSFHRALKPSASSLDQRYETMRNQSAAGNGSELLFTSEAWTSVNYAVDFGIFLLGFSPDRMLRRIIGLRVPSKQEIWFGSM